MAADLKAYVKDMTKCPICLEDTDDPRSLPCLHTFCFACISDHCGYKCPGDDVECPVCRKEFQIPADGPGSIQRNFFLAELISAMRSTFTSKRRKSEVAGDTKFNAGDAPEVASNEPKFFEPRSQYCDEHGEMLKMYCTECMFNICKACFADRHRQHECQEIEDVAKEHTVRIRGNIEALTKMLRLTEQAKTNVAGERRHFVANVNKIQFILKRKGDEMKAMIDRQTDDLLLQVQQIQVEALKAVDGHVSSIIDAQLVILESFVNYAKELTDKGSPSDITRVAGDLESRASELKTFVVSVPQNLFPSVTFVPASIDVKVMTVGSISVVSLNDIRGSSRYQLPVTVVAAASAKLLGESQASRQKMSDDTFSGLAEAGEFTKKKKVPTATLR